MKDNQNTYIVYEAIDGCVAETRLEKEQAEKLYRKIRSKGGEAHLRPEPFVSGFGREVKYD